MSRGGPHYFPSDRTKRIEEILADAQRPRSAREIREALIDQHGVGWLGGMTCSEIAGHIRRHMVGRVTHRKIGAKRRYILVGGNADVPKCYAEYETCRVGKCGYKCRCASVSRRLRETTV
jgi:hypothetical protein